MHRCSGWVVCTDDWHLTYTHTIPHTLKHPVVRRERKVNIDETEHHSICNMQSCMIPLVYVHVQYLPMTALFYLSSAWLGIIWKMSIWCLSFRTPLPKQYFFQYQRLRDIMYKHVLTFLLMLSVSVLNNRLRPTKIEFSMQWLSLLQWFFYSIQTYCFCFTSLLLL